MKKPRVYRDHRPLIIAVRVFIGVLAAVIALCIFFFFWCRRYIVIENGELRLEPPWEQRVQSEAEIRE